MHGRTHARRRQCVCVCGADKQNLLASVFHHSADVRSVCLLARAQARNTDNAATRSVLATKLKDGGEIVVAPKAIHVQNALNPYARSAVGSTSCGPGGAGGRRLSIDNGLPPAAGVGPVLPLRPPGYPPSACAVDRGRCASPLGRPAMVGLSSQRCLAVVQCTRP